MFWATVARANRARRCQGPFSVYRAREARWLLAIPDAISQLEALDRQLVTRRDIEQLFGVGKVRAAAFMQTFGAELVGNQRTLRRTRLLQQLKKHRSRNGVVRRRGETRAWPPSSRRPG